jgi:hypothetical protein
MRNQRSIIRVIGLFCLLGLIACQNSRQTDRPEIILWAWERPENLEFIDSPEIAVAFLAQTIALRGDRVELKPRRQPLKVRPETRLIAVTRIETDKRSAPGVTFSDRQRQEVGKLILRTLELKNVSAIQIDFDVTVAERDFYRQLLAELRSELRPGIGLTITALASWCAGDNWFGDLPVDEAVPMIFEMGADEKVVRDFLAAGEDWTEPLCRHSYGLSVNEPLKIKFRPDRKFYLFTANPNGWKKSDLERIEWLRSR